MIFKKSLDKISPMYLKMIVLNVQFSMPIGSSAITFLKASIMACMIYVPGAAFSSHNNFNSLFSDVCPK